MDSLICFVNTMIIGMLSSALYFVARDVDRLALRVEELEEDSLVLDDYEDDEEDEEEEEDKGTVVEDVKKDN